MLENVWSLSWKDWACGLGLRAGTGAICEITPFDFLCFQCFGIWDLPVLEGPPKLIPRDSRHLPCPRVALLHANQQSQRPCPKHFLYYTLVLQATILMV